MTQTDPHAAMRSALEEAMLAVEPLSLLDASDLNDPLSKWLTFGNLIAAKEAVESAKAALATPPPVEQVAGDAAPQDALTAREMLDKAVGIPEEICRVIGALPGSSIHSALADVELQLKRLRADALTGRPVIAPTGFVLVPREPTMDQLNAAVSSTGAGSGMSWNGRSPQSLFRQAWTAMLAAAPSEQPIPVGEGLERLRELSERATAGPWMQDENCVSQEEVGGYCSIAQCGKLVKYGAAHGIHGEFGHYEQTEANAAFIVAAVNHVRAILHPTKAGEKL